MLNNVTVYVDGGDKFKVSRSNFDRLSDSLTVLVVLEDCAAFLRC